MFWKLTISSLPFANDRPSALTLHSSLSACVFNNMSYEVTASRPLEVSPQNQHMGSDLKVSGGLTKVYTKQRKQHLYIYIYIYIYMYYIIYITKPMMIKWQLYTCLVVKYDQIRYAKCSYYIEHRNFVIFAVFLALSILAWKRYKSM